MELARVRSKRALPVLLAAALCVSVMVVFQRHAVGKTWDTTGLGAYQTALQQHNTAAQIAALQHFLSAAERDPLATSALEFLVWDYMQTGAPIEATRTARTLLTADPGNAIALAALADPNGGNPTGDDNERFQAVTRGLSEFARLQKPVGMTREEFFRLQLRVLSTLNGEAGLGYLGRKDYAAARQHLQQAVAAAPKNARYVYGLGLAMLKQKQPQAFWYLACAVNLSRGTPQGDSIADFAKKQYLDAGGSSDNWDRFLVAAAALTSAEGSAAMQSSGSHGSSSTARNSPALSGRSSFNSNTSRPVSGRNEITTGSLQSTTIGRPFGSSSAAAVAMPPRPMQSASIAAANPPAHNVKASPTQVPALPPSREPAPSDAIQLPPVHRNVFIPRDAPLSLGILIQKSRLTPEDRNAILFSLSDLVRHLRQDDEVFIMGFSSQLEFEQDLTRNAKLLEEAIAAMKPQSGAALLDAVAFAAGHLERISKNRNRVLLVIADGRDAAHASSSEIGGVLGQVRVDCIGLEVDDAAGMNLLQSLARYSGGQTSFASGPQQFRTATWEFAKSMGIEFPY